VGHIITFNRGDDNIDDLKQFLRSAKGLDELRLACFVGAEIMLQNLLYCYVDVSMFEKLSLTYNIEVVKQVRGDDEEYGVNGRALNIPSQLFDVKAHISYIETTSEDWITHTWSVNKGGKLLQTNAIVRLQHIFQDLGSS
jgi:hypothetical protein